MASDIEDNAREMFQVLKAAVPSRLARLGRLSLPSRGSIDTPSFIALTSRGVVPHMSPDTLRDKTDIDGLYIALEDFIERVKDPPILSEQNIASSSPLRAFISAPHDRVLVLSARRTPPVVSPWSNSQTAVSIYTSNGFATLTAREYAEAATKLRPDVMVGLADIPDVPQPGPRRVEKMSSRTEQYLGQLLETCKAKGDSRPPIFAPVLPTSCQAQSLYLEMLETEWRQHIAGLAVYDADVVPQLPSSLESLPRLSMSSPSDPHRLLREIQLGNDIFVLSFVGHATDAGIALDFAFPPKSGMSQQPMGHDMWMPEHQTSLEPLVAGCDCYACTRHHRAYVQHLLSAKEMLAWVLLQIHNNRVLERFFASVRASIADNTFEENVDVFTKAHVADLPQKTGQGPRVRGYQYKSEGPGEKKRNPSAFTALMARPGKPSLPGTTIVTDSETAGDSTDRG